MKILDKYILRTLLSTFFFVVLILLAVITVIDLTEKMDKFAKAGVSSGQIAAYYLDYISWIGSFITPITMFIATVYVCARMAGHTEVVAILSSGVSFRRFLLPFLVGAAIIGGISFFLNAWIIPDSNKSRLEFEVQYIKSKYYFDKRNIHMQVAPDIYLYLQSYNNNTNTGYHFSIERFRDNRLIEKLTANRIEWDSVKQKWTLRDYKIRKIDRVFETASRPESIPGFETNKVALSRDSLTGGASLDTALVIHPKEFESDYRKYDGMTLNELDDYIRTLKARGSTGVEVYVVEKIHPLLVSIHDPHSCIYGCDRLIAEEPGRHRVADRGRFSSFVHLHSVFHIIPDLCGSGINTAGDLCLDTEYCFCYHLTWHVQIRSALNDLFNGLPQASLHCFSLGFLSHTWKACFHSRS